MKKFKIKWEVRRAVCDSYGDEVDMYIERLSGIYEAESEDSAIDAWESEHAHDAITGSCDDCVEVVG